MMYRIGSIACRCLEMKAIPSMVKPFVNLDLYLLRNYQYLGSRPRMLTYWVRETQGEMVMKILCGKKNSKKGAQFYLEHMDYLVLNKEI